VEAQDQGARLTEDFLNRAVENLRTQAERNREMTQQLADQQQRRAEATQQLTQESVDAYMSFVNSMFSFQREGIGAAQRATDQAAGRCTSLVARGVVRAHAFTFFILQGDIKSLLMRVGVLA